jgi:hypothetical protein
MRNVKLTKGPYGFMCEIFNSAGKLLAHGFGAYAEGVTRAKALAVNRALDQLKA